MVAAISCTNHFLTLIPFSLFCVLTVIYQTPNFNWLPMVFFCLHVFNLWLSFSGFWFPNDSVAAFCHPTHSPFLDFSPLKNKENQTGCGSVSGFWDRCQIRLAICINFQKKELLRCANPVNKEKRLSYD